MKVKIHVAFLLIFIMTANLEKLTENTSHHMVREGLSTLLPACFYEQLALCLYFP